MRVRFIFPIVGVIAVAQLAQPDRRVPLTDPNTDLMVMTRPSAEVRTLLEGACYDCHSYATNYPWYAYVTPVNFWMQHHIDEGREVVNFSRWDVFSGSEEAGESAETILEDEMPPGYYTLMHAHGRLNATEKQLLARWFRTVAPGEGGTDGTRDEQEGEE